MKVRITIIAELTGRCGSPRIDRLAETAQNATFRHRDDTGMMVVRSVETTWVHLPQD